MSQRIAPEDGGPAYPAVRSEKVMCGEHYVYATVQHHGMLLRDYFAAHAIAGVLATAGGTAALAAYAYEMADAMLEARK